MKCRLWYIAFLLLFSCKKEINITIPDKAPVLVVNSELQIDSLISFRLSLTQNISNNNPPPEVTDASIEVMNKDTVILDVLTNLGSGLYRSSFMKAKPATMYLFRITKDGNEYWINERMPDTLKSVLSDTSRIVFQGKSNFFQFKVKINDQVLEDNYYSFKLKRTYKKIVGLDTTLAEEWMDIESIDFILTENHESKFSKKHLLFKDTYFNGLNQEFKCGTSLQLRSDQKTTGLYLYIGSYSEYGYNYYTSVNEHLLYQNDPFSQPTVLRGNVSNAFGAAVGNYTTVYKVVLN